MRKAGSSSPRNRACKTNPGLWALAPLAVARKSRRLVSHSKTPTAARARAHCHHHKACPACGSGAEALTAPIAARVQNFTAVFGGHTRTEPVATLAHKIRWLKCALHNALLRRCRSVVPPLGGLDSAQFLIEAARLCKRPLTVNQSLPLLAGPHLPVPETIFAQFCKVSQQLRKQTHARVR